MERVVKFQEHAVAPGGTQDLAFGNFRRFSFFGGTPQDIPGEFRPFFDQAVRDGSFFVFTDAEVNQKLNDVTTQITNRHTTLSQQVDQKLVDHEAKLRADVVRVIDQLPQRVLADTAAQTLKDAILVELRAELAQLRRGLQIQIDTLKAAPVPGE